MQYRSRDRNLTHSEIRTCKDCGTELHGEYCSSCGQRDIALIKPINELAKEFGEEVVSFDDRLFRSLKPFLLKPGFLTNEYLAGRRKRYISPFKMYVIISFIFFFVSALRHVGYNEIIGNKHSLQDTLQTLKETNKRAVSIRDSVSGFGVTLSDTVAAQKFFGKGFVDGFKLGKENPNLLFDTIKEHRQKIIFMLLPVFALILKLLYRRSKILYIQHIIFSFYFHSYIFLIFLIISLIKMTGLHWLMSYANIIYSAIPIYLYFGLKQVYGQSNLKTSIKIILLSGSYIFIFFLFMTVSALIVIYLLYM